MIVYTKTQQSKLLQSLIDLPLKISQPHLTSKPKIQLHPAKVLTTKTTQIKEKNKNSTKKTVQENLSNMAQKATPKLLLNSWFYRRFIEGAQTYLYNTQKGNPTLSKTNAILNKDFSL